MKVNNITDVSKDNTFPVSMRSQNGIQILMKLF